MIRRYFPKSLQELVHWYERYISPLSLVAGFLADNFILLKRVDMLQTNLLLGSYLIASASGILLLHYIESGRVKNAYILKASPLIPVVVQFAFGGLFSGYLSLYSRSASIAVSWIFILLIGVFLLANERFTRLYMRFTVQIGIYFALVFSFLIFFLPVVIHRIGPYMFFASGIASLVIVAGFLYLLRIFIPEIVKRDITIIARTIAIIFVVFNILYFTNVIPPLPLALKDAGVYHSLAHDASGGYKVTEEPQSWYLSFFRRYNPVFHAANGEGVYVYTSIFAPTGLSTTVVHQWQWYDEAAKEWVSAGAIRFNIVGGRDNGYRGYSFKGGLKPGSWRVNVLTSYGQQIGRVSFTIVPSTGTISLENVVK
jgi:hypothetical protein